MHTVFGEVKPYAFVRCQGGKHKHGLIWEQTAAPHVNQQGDTFLQHNQACSTSRAPTSEGHMKHRDPFTLKWISPH